MDVERRGCEGTNPNRRRLTTGSILTRGLIRLRSLNGVSCGAGTDDIGRSSSVSIMISRTPSSRPTSSAT